MMQVTETAIGENAILHLQFYKHNFLNILVGNICSHKEVKNQ